VLFGKPATCGTCPLDRPCRHLRQPTARTDALETESKTGRPKAANRITDTVFLTSFSQGGGTTHDWLADGTRFEVPVCGISATSASAI
jgi:hypothetical protein